MNTCHHCWHLDFSAVVLDMAPPLYGFQCCHCAHYQHMTDDSREAIVPNEEPHGTHIPSEPSAY